MKQSFSMKLVAMAALAAAAVGASAAGKVQTGTVNGVTWTAQSMLTGTTSTLNGGPIANGGNPIYWPSYPRDSGLVHLVMDYGPTVGAFICSGTLLNDRRSILTAAHCVSDGAGSANPLTTTVYFQPLNGLGAGTRIQTNQIPNGGAVTRNVGAYNVHSLYTGNVIDHNDVAVLTLDSLAPDWAASYGLYTNSDLTGQTATITGYGRLGDGATGANNFTARLRTGDNRLEYRLGDADFGPNGWADEWGRPITQISHSWVSDFDNGNAANDAACKTVFQVFGFGPNSKWCDDGVGAREVGVAGGDSGGGGFIDGMVATINSYGLTYGAPSYGDVDTLLNSSFGEFSGYVPVYLHADWINSVMVPEPETYALMGLGLAAVGFVARRRRVQKA